MANESAATDMSPYIIVLIVITAVAAAAGGIYLSGYGEDMAKYMMESMFKYKAKAEEKALEHVGEEKAQAFLKDQLKKNPVVSNEKLNSIQSGLGDEAEREFGGGKGGLGAMAQGIGKAFD